MKKSLGKWEQSVVLQQDQFVAKHLPETREFSERNLNDLLSRYPSVYVKHDSTGQGRAIFKIRKSNGGYYINGFTIQGTPIKKSVATVDELRQILHPFIKFARESGRYIIQEDIRSYTLNGQPFAIRVHVQKMNNDWLIGGILGNIANDSIQENGIVNRCRGATLLTVSELLSLTTNSHQHTKIVKKLEEVAISAAQAIHSVFPCRENGMDFGNNQEGIPNLFEGNTTPGISGFAQIDIETWKRIVAIRKMQSE